MRGVRVDMQRGRGVSDTPSQLMDLESGRSDSAEVSGWDA